MLAATRAPCSIYYGIMSDVPIRFSQHALDKFQVLEQHGLKLDPAQVEATVRRPDRVAPGYAGRLIAQGPLDADRVLRVVYEQTQEGIIIVTFYPGKRARYEQDQV
jgi:hypothetical protein